MIPTPNFSFLPKEPIPRLRQYRSEGFCMFSLDWMNSFNAKSSAFLERLETKTRCLHRDWVS